MNFAIQVANELRRVLIFSSECHIKVLNNSLEDGNQRMKVVAEENAAAKGHINSKMVNA